MGKQLFLQNQTKNQATQKIVPNIIKEKFQEQESNRVLENSQPNLECSICYSNVVDQGIVQQCQHIFCFQCIKTWAKQSLSCPQCRSSFTKINRIWKQGCVKKKRIYNFKKPKIKKNEIISISNNLNSTELLSQRFRR